MIKDAKSQEPLLGVNVFIDGTTTGTVSDLDGNFSLSGVSIGQTLVFSFIGYEDQKVTITNYQPLRIQMAEATTTLGEIVVIGYGEVKKKDATGSVTSVTEKDFNKGPLVSPEQLLTGKVAGLQIISDGGAPGDGARIRIRSGSSLSANNDPLYVIDGVPVDAGGIASLRNPLTTINQNDIESITILKDASATAIYGARASNGVVIITTKKGKAGDIKVSYNANVSVGTIQEKVNVLTADQFRSYVRANGNEQQIGLLGNANTDWQDEIYQNAFGTDHNLSISGGFDKVGLRASLGYTNMNGILRKDNLERYTLSLGATSKFFDDHLKVDLNNKSTLVSNYFANGGAIGAAITFDPTQPVFAENEFGGYFQWLSPDGRRLQLAGVNPVGLLEQQFDAGNALRHIGNAQLDYKLHFLPQVRAVVNLGYDISNSNSTRVISNRSIITALPDGTNPGAADRFNSSKNNQLLDFYLNYTERWGELALDVTGGYTYQNFEYNANAFVNNPNDPNAPLRQIPITDFLNLQSFFGRANLNFYDKYLLTASIRRDGSSRFSGSDNQWGIFPAAAFAWKISEENFLKGKKTISNLKLRLGWGITGQQDIGNLYPAIPLYLGGSQTAQYQFGDDFVTTFRPQPYNRSLKWEETTTLNAGLDFGLFSERITGSVDAYYRTTNDLLNFIPFPAGSSLSNADFANIGSLVNKGIELTLNYLVVDRDRISWNVGANVTFQDSRITQLVGGENSSFIGFPTGGFAGGVGNTIQINSAGFSPNAFFVYEQLYDANGRPVEGAFVDRNQDGRITEADRYRYRRPASDIFYGINTNLQVGNFDFSMVWRGSFGNFVYNNVQSNLAYANNILRYNNTLTNSVSNLLETNFVNEGNNRYLSDYYIQDGSFVKLDNVTLGYDFGRLGRSKATLKMIGSVQNVLIISDYDGIDPEIANGINYTLYPRPRTYMLGFNVNF